MSQTLDKSFIITEDDNKTPVFAFMGGDLKNCADDVIDWCLDNNLTRWVRYQLPIKLVKYTNHGLMRVSFCKDNDSVKKEVRNHIMKIGGTILCDGLVKRGINR